MKKKLPVILFFAILAVIAAVGGADRLAPATADQLFTAGLNPTGSSVYAEEQPDASAEPGDASADSGESEDPSEPVAAVCKIRLSKKIFSYTGAVQKPEVTVTADGNPAEAKVTFDRGCKKVGVYHVKAELTGEYMGSAEETFKIIPNRTRIVRLTPIVKGFKAEWKAQTVGTTGYQIRYTRDQNFETGLKTATVGRNTKVTRTIKDLGQRKTYYVKVRTFAKVDGVRLYSSWSKAKSVRTKAVVEPPELKWADWASGSQVSVRWTVVPGAEGYYIYRAPEEKGTYKRIRTNAGRDEVRAVVKEKRANGGWYKIRTFKTVKGKRKLSPWSNAVKCVKYKDSNLGYLFPSGPPTSEAVMRTYLVSVRLKVRTPGGGSGHITLPIHRKLVSRVKAAFEDMYDLGFKVRSSDTGSYNWRKMRTVNLMSHHSYGCVVDLNWQANPMVELSQIGHSAYNPKKNSYSINEKVVQVWKDHGFYWGGDWTEKKDYMHLTYTNN